MKRRKAPVLVLHEASEFCSDLTETEPTVFTCLCIQGNKRESTQEEFGAWQAHSLTEMQLEQVCSTISEHLTSTLFLDEYAQSLRQKNTSKQQKGQNTQVQRVAVARKKNEDTVYHYSFNHLHSSEDYIKSYRNVRHSNTVNSLSTNDTMKVDHVPRKEIELKDPLLRDNSSPDFAKFTKPVRFRNSPMIIYKSTNGVYMEPFYPALYGQPRARLPYEALCPDVPETTGPEPSSHTPDMEEHDGCWVPENAVFRIRQSNMASYHSVGYYGDEMVKLQNIRKTSHKKSTSSCSDSGKKTGPSEATILSDYPLIKNKRSSSGRPIALIQLKKERGGDSGDAFKECTCSDDAEANESGPSIELQNSNITLREYQSGKLLQGKLKSPFGTRSDIGQQNPLVVHSNSFKNLHLQQSPESQSEGKRRKKTKTKIKTIKQESVQSIPSRDSSRTYLPGLEVRPTSSLQGKKKKGTSQKDDAQRSSPEADSKIVMNSPTVVNQSLQSKSRTEVCKERKKPSAPSPMTVLHSVSSRLKPINHNTHLKTLTSKLFKTPEMLQTSLLGLQQSTDTNLSSKTLHHEGTQLLSVHTGAFYKPQEKASIELSYRHKIATLKKMEEETTVASSSTTQEVKMIRESSHCALRSQQRRQRQQQKALTGHSSNSVVNNDSTLVCVKNPRLKVKVYVKGKTKPLVNLLPSLDTPKMTGDGTNEVDIPELLYAE